MKKALLALLFLVIVQLACSFGNSKKVNALIQQGNQLVEEEKYTEAISIYNQALELNSKSSAAYAGRGTANRLLGNYQQALADLNEALNADNKNYKAYRERGMVYYQTNDNASALSDCNESVSLNSNYALGHLCLGYVYDAESNYDLAYSEYSKTIELDPNQVWAYANRGYILFSYNKKYSEAVADLSKAIELKPDWDYPYFYRGYSFYYMQEYTNAIADFEHILSISNYAYYLNESYGLLGDSYYYQGNYQKAVEYYTSAIENTSNTDLVRLYYNRAHAYDKLSQNENTISDLTKYLELDKSNSKQAMDACARLNYLTIWGSSNLFSFFFNAVAPPCQRNQGYSNNEDYSTPEENLGNQECDDACVGEILAEKKQFEEQLQQEAIP